MLQSFYKMFWFAVFALFLSTPYASCASCEGDRVSIAIPSTFGSVDIEPKLEQAVEIDDYVLANAWRVSPLACALRFSADEQSTESYFESAPHLKYISDAIVDAVEGIGPKRIIVNMPPRHGKSTFVTRRTPQWYLARFPHRTVGMCGYGQQFAEEWGRKVRNDLKQHEDRLGFGLASDSTKVAWWHTSAGGGMWTAGVNGQITGKGADFLVIDDPIKSDKEAFSLTYRDDVWNWWMKDVQSRTYQHSVILIVMTRWHTDDLCGRLLSLEHPGDPADWRVISMPAIWEKDAPDMLGRKKGDALWPKFYPADFLNKDRKKTMTEEGWLSLFQQQPVNQTGVGAVYKNYDESTHVYEQERDDHLPLCWSLDFNVNPMCSVIAQYREEFAANAHLTNEKLKTLEVLDEICLPNAQTIEACQEFDERARKILRGRRCEIHVHGDATANRRDTRGADSDWEIIKRFLREHNYSFKTFVGQSNPAVRDRVNAMNTALRAADGRVSLFVDPRCKMLRTDLKEVRWKKDAAGNSTHQLDSSDPQRTHVSDALGYLVYDKFKITGHAYGSKESLR